MSQSDWLTDPDDPEPASPTGYAWEDERLSRRKRYLFMAAVGRLAEPLMMEPTCARMPAACEAYAEGKIDEREFYAWCDEATNEIPRDGPAAEQAACAFVQLLGDDGNDGKLRECVDAAACAFGYAAAVEAGELEAETDVGCGEALDHFPAFRAGSEAAERRFAELCRDIFGPDPFDPSAFDPAWLTADVLAIARGVHAERAYGRLPVLADALAEAGCDDAGLLAHCRSGGPHVRGCWAVDGVLGLG